MNFKGFSGLCPTKKQKKEKIEAKKKEKILTKLVVRKEDKGFNVTKCRFVDDTLGNEFMGCFPFGNHLLQGVSIDVHRFTKALPNIVYCPFSNVHKDDFFIKITQYNKFETNVPIFVIPEDPHSVEHITPYKSKKWEDIQDN
jgi:hypothetical protein